MCRIFEESLIISNKLRLNLALFRVLVFTKIILDFQLANGKSILRRVDSKSLCAFAIACLVRNLSRSVKINNVRSNIELRRIDTYTIFKRHRIGSSTRNFPTDIAFAVILDISSGNRRIYSFACKYSIRSTHIVIKNNAISRNGGSDTFQNVVKSDVRISL